jgi:hypothetical protein
VGRLGQDAKALYFISSEPAEAGAARPYRIMKLAK